LSPLSDDPAKRGRQLANLRAAPPAPPGNDRTLQHGGYADIARERLEEKQREVFDALAADAPLRDERGGLPAADAPMVELLCTALCRLENVREYLARRGWQDGKGRPRPAVELESRLRKEAADYLDALGMTPRSRVRLGLDITRARDLASEMSDG
jgi:phage terminase small subunit